MRQNEFDNRYDESFRRYAQNIRNSIIAAQETFDKNEYYNALNYMKRIIYMLEPNAKRLAFKCNTSNEYNYKIDKIYKGEKKADVFE